MVFLFPELHLDILTESPTLSTADIYTDRYKRLIPLLFSYRDIFL
jgi:hypothetical protein